MPTPSKRWQNLLIRLLPFSDSCGFAQLSKRATYFGEFVPLVLRCRLDSFDALRAIAMPHEAAKENRTEESEGSEL
jgi:hypothetical protein